MQALPAPAQQAYITDFADALTGTFRYAAPLMLLALGLALAMKEIPLRITSGRGDGPHAVHPEALTPEPL